jgi:membrane protease YdiL (CAAX protease family)
MKKYTEGWRLVLSVGLVFGIFHFLALALGSDRGQYGLLVGAIVVVATIAAERLLFGTPPGHAVGALGLQRVGTRGILAALGVAAALLLVFPIYSATAGQRLEMYPGWAGLLPGLFAQGGIAEEVLFRGHLFRHVRPGRAFWPAVALAAIPFVIAHLILFTAMPWPLALASVLLSAVISPPLAYLFELGGGSVWGPAIVHFVVQGAIKVVVVTNGGPQLPLIWMAASAVLPYLVFLIPRPTSRPA